jgi:hypothetical protein
MPQPSKRRPYNRAVHPSVLEAQADPSLDLSRGSPKQRRALEVETSLDVKIAIAKSLARKDKRPPREYPGYMAEAARIFAERDATRQSPSE